MKYLNEINVSCLHKYGVRPSLWFTLKQLSHKERKNRNFFIKNPNIILQANLHTFQLSMIPLFIGLRNP